MDLTNLFQFIAVAGMVIGGGLIGCATNSPVVNDFASDVDEAITKYEEEIRPETINYLGLVFGVDEDGDIDEVARDDVPVERMGIQDFVYSKFNKYNQDEKEKLREINRAGKQMLSRMRQIDRRIQNKKGDARKVVNEIKRLNEQLEDKEALESAGEILKSIVSVYVKTK